MKEGKNSFKLLMEEGDYHYEAMDHEEIKHHIHRQVGVLKFIGSVSDMYLGKMFNVVGMFSGSRHEHRDPASAEGPAGPGTPGNPATR